ncbi:hypothetical protein [Providencia manganoxydans]|uniref:hypothetical protein n=1 Tax=Providencia manganoxydans TaxID=2923283 RepID=UPI0034E4DFD9
MNLKQDEKELIHAFEYVVNNNKDKISLFSQQHKSFENWLTMELNYALISNGLKSIPMPRNKDIKKYLDLSFGVNRSDENFVEIKIRITYTQDKYLNNTLLDFDKLKSIDFNCGKYLLFISTFENEIRNSNQNLKYIKKYDQYISNLLEGAKKRNSTILYRNDFTIKDNNESPCEVIMIIFKV